MIAPSEKQSREGLHGIILLSLFYFWFLVAAMLVRHDFHLSVLGNRLLCLALFHFLHSKFRSQQIPVRYYNLVSLLIGCAGLLSVSISYACGAVSHIAMRIALMIVFSSVSGIERLSCLVYHLICLASCAFLQTHFPSLSDPHLNLAVPAIAMLLGHSISEARFQTTRLLNESHSQFLHLGEKLRQTLQQARASQASLDADVEAATQDLALTNSQLQQAIDLQIAAFAQNQQLQQQMGEALGFQAVGKAAGAAAHDFNNLLSVIACSVELVEEELLEQESSPSQQRDSHTVAILSAEITRAIKVGRDILALSGKQVVRPQLFLLRDWLSRGCQCSDPGISIQIVVHCSEPEVRLLGDFDQLCRVLAALVRNSSEAMSSGGTLRVTVTDREQEVLVQIQDEGPGIVDWLEPILFQPFLTTKETMLHSGLGLAAARAVARQHGGDLNYTPGPRGATFWLRLPVQQGAA